MTTIDDGLEARAKTDPSDDNIMAVWSRYQPAINNALRKAQMPTSGGKLGSTEGFAAFAEAFNSWNPEKGYFGPWLKQKLWGLLEKQKADEAPVRLPQKMTRAYAKAKVIPSDNLALLPSRGTATTEDRALLVDDDAEPNTGMALDLEQEMSKLELLDRDLLTMLGVGTSLAEIAKVQGGSYQAIQQRAERIKSALMAALERRGHRRAELHALFRYLNDPDGTSALHEVLAQVDVDRGEDRVVKRTEEWTDEDARGLLLLSVFGQVKTFDWAEK